MIFSEITPAGKLRYWLIVTQIALEEIMRKNKPVNLARGRRKGRRGRRY